MKDPIERQDAIDALWEIRQEEISDGRRFHNYCSLSTAVDVIKDLPSAEPEMNFDEWCTDCKEYDQERHCCPRWNRVIRQTLNDAQPEIIRCKDCKYRGGFSGFYCDIVEKAVGTDSFCSWAERIRDEKNLGESRNVT